MDKHELYNKIIEILILTQFEHWVEPKNDHLTAMEVISRPERAIDYYLGREKGKKPSELPNYEMTRFHSLVCLQANLIMRAMEDTDKFDFIEVPAEDIKFDGDFTIC